MHLLRRLLCAALATAIWVGSLHVAFERAPAAVAAPLAERQLEAFERDESLAELRRSNPEWDLMARTFAVLAFANLALREPREAARYQAAIDRIIATTRADVAAHGPRYFLLPYGHHATHSLFVDGELALMMAARGAHPELAVRIERIVAELERAPALLGESYPDEAWLFCNVVALAAIRLADRAAGEPDRHAALIARWVANARANLVDPTTGLLVSKTDRAGRALEGPEGSTIWLVAALLRIVDDDLARDQYARAKSELAGDLAGFAWAREWPASWPGGDDVDSGPTIPIVGANAGSSGLALVAARAFDDRDFTDGLVASLQLAGFPLDGGAAYAAGNRLADLVILYALVQGPLEGRA